MVALVVTTPGEDGNPDWRRTLPGDDMGSVGAELAFTTDSNYRGRGIPTLILRHLAREAGVLRFDEIFSRRISLLSFGIAAWQCNFAGDDGVLHMTLSLQPD